MGNRGHATIAEPALLSALRGDQSVEEVCRAAGATVDEFAATREALLKRRLPPVEARLAAAVRGPVEILRDRAGVPHVYAGTTDDLYVGVGFAMAQDRLWQMDRLRRRALGRQAEVLGPAYVKSDLIHRTVGIDRVSEAEVDRTDERTRAIIDATVAGINRQIEASGKDLPVEFAILDYEPEPFTARDVIAILRGIWWSLNGRLENIVAAEAARLLPEVLRDAYLTPESPEHRIVPPGSPYPEGGVPLAALRDPLVGMGDSTGSNNWAVAGSKTPTGHAVLCSDPHQAFWLPSSWYEYGLHGPEEDAAGAGHPGVPGLWWGLNGDIAWGITNNGSSTRDLYAEEVDSRDHSRYRDGDGWRTFQEETITIAVRGEAEQRHTIRSTVRGPILNPCLPSIDEGGDPPLSLRWVGREHLDDVRALVGIARSHDWPSFRAALSDWSVPIFNFVYADREGRVNYQCAGRVPLRGRIKYGYRDPSNPADSWQGYIPYDAMPRLENPPRGYVASANERAVPDDYPFPFYGAFAGGHRALRIKRAIESQPTFSAEDGRALQNSALGIRAERYAPQIVRRLEGSDDADVQLLVETLRSWDYVYSLDATAPALFEGFMQNWGRRVARERFPERLLPLVGGAGGAGALLLEADDLDWLTSDKTAALIETAKTTVADLRAAHGPDPAEWQWGKLHKAHWKHVLSNPATAPVFDIGPASLDGCGDTVRNNGTGIAPNFAADGGTEYRLIADFTAPTRFLAVQNVGNSGQPGSPHYADQFAPWRAGEYHTVHLRREAIEDDLEGKTALVPGTTSA